MTQRSSSHLCVFFHYTLKRKQTALGVISFLSKTVV